MILDSIKHHFVEDLPKGLSILLYGSGGRGLSIFNELKRIRKDIQVYSFADSSKTGELEGLPILSPEAMVAKKNDFDAVCIVSHWWKEIAVNLSNFGINNIIILASKSIQGKIKQVTVSDKRQFIYIGTPRSGSSALHYCLGSNFVTDAVQKDIDISNPKYKNYFKFTFVRNPWDRVLSCYVSKIVNAVKNPLPRKDEMSLYVKPISTLLGKNELTFDDFVQFITHERDGSADPHWRAQHTFSYDVDGLLIADYIGRLEIIDEDFNIIRKEIGTDINIIRSSQSGKKGPYQDAYNDNSQKLIAERFKKDIQLFDYQFK